MGDVSGGSASSGQLPRFDSAASYNAQYPTCPTRPHAAEWNELVSYLAGGGGIDDDVTGLDLCGNRGLVLDFLPGGAAGRDKPDRTGTVVASCWGTAPYVVLAADISLRAAWLAVVRRWCITLSEVRHALEVELPELE